MLDVKKFRDDVYAIVASIPRGKVLTYGQIAWLVGYPKHSRLVGRVLQGASDELRLPCHRVVNCKGRTAPSWHDQINLLKSEGVTFKKSGCVDINTCRWDFCHVQSLAGLCRFVPIALLIMLQVSQYRLLSLSLSI